MDSRLLCELNEAKIVFLFSPPVGKRQKSKKSLKEEKAALSPWLVLIMFPSLQPENPSSCPAARSTWTVARRSVCSLAKSQGKRHTATRLGYLTGAQETGGATKGGG